MIKKIIVSIVVAFAVIGLFFLPEKFNPVYLLLFVPILVLAVKELRK